MYCFECEWFESGEVESLKEHTGSCHRYPPPDGPDSYPSVEGDDWCGEFKAKEVHGS
jgi:hypothetical protein